MTDRLDQTIQKIMIGVGVASGVFGFVVGFIAGVYLVWDK